MAQRQQGNEEKMNQQKVTNDKSGRGVQTVPADESRDQKIKNEPGTERLRSERQSVKDGEQNKNNG